MSETSIKIGELLVRAGVVTGVDLQEAETLAKHMQVQFGRILIMSGCLTEHDLECALEAQSLIKSHQLSISAACEALALASREQMPLQEAVDSMQGFVNASSEWVAMAELLADAAILSPEQLEESLDTCLSSHVPLGKVLISAHLVPTSLIPRLEALVAQVRSGEVEHEVAMLEIRKTYDFWAKADISHGTTEAGKPAELLKPMEKESAGSTSQQMQPYPNDPYYSGIHHPIYPQGGQPRPGYPGAPDPNYPPYGGYPPGYPPPPQGYPPPPGYPQHQGYPANQSWSGSTQSWHGGQYLPPYPGQAQGYPPPPGYPNQHGYPADYQQHQQYPPEYQQGYPQMPNNDPYQSMPPHIMQQQIQQQLQQQQQQQQQQLQQQQQQFAQQQQQLQQQFGQQPQQPQSNPAFQQQFGQQQTQSPSQQYTNMPAMQPPPVQLQPQPESGSTSPPAPPFDAVPQLPPAESLYTAPPAVEQVVSPPPPPPPAPAVPLAPAAAAEPAAHNPPPITAQITPDARPPATAPVEVVAPNVVPPAANGSQERESAPPAGGSPVPQAWLQSLLAAATTTTPLPLKPVNTAPQTDADGWKLVPAESESDSKSPSSPSHEPSFKQPVSWGRTARDSKGDLPPDPPAAPPVEYVAPAAPSNYSTPLLPEPELLGEEDGQEGWHEFPQQMLDTAVDAEAYVAPRPTIPGFSPEVDHLSDAHAAIDAFRHANEQAQSQPVPEPIVEKKPELPVAPAAAFAPPPFPEARVERRGYAEQVEHDEDYHREPDTAPAIKKAGSVSRTAPVIELMQSAGVFTTGELSVAVAKALSDQAKALQLIRSVGITRQDMVDAAAACCSALAQERITQAQAKALLTSMKSGHTLTDAMADVGISPDDLLASSERRVRLWKWPGPVRPYTRETDRQPSAPPQQESDSVPSPESMEMAQSITSAIDNSVLAPEVMDIVIKAQPTVELKKMGEQEIADYQARKLAETSQYADSLELHPQPQQMDHPKPLDMAAYNTQHPEEHPSDDSRAKPSGVFANMMAKWRKPAKIRKDSRSDSEAEIASPSMEQSQFDERQEEVAPNAMSLPVEGETEARVSQESNVFEEIHEERYEVAEGSGSVEQDEPDFEVPELAASIAQDESDFEVPELAGSVEQDEPDFEVPELAPSIAQAQSDFKVPELAASVEQDEPDFEVPALAASVEQDEPDFDIPPVAASAARHERESEGLEAAASVAAMEDKLDLEIQQFDSVKTEIREPSQYVEPAIADLPDLTLSTPALEEVAIASGILDEDWLEDEPVESQRQAASETAVSETVIALLDDDWLDDEEDAEPTAVAAKASTQDPPKSPVVADDEVSRAIAMIGDEDWLEDDDTGHHVQRPPVQPPSPAISNILEQMDELEVATSWDERQPRYDAQSPLTISSPSLNPVPAPAARTDNGGSDHQTKNGGEHPVHTPPDLDAEAQDLSGLDRVARRRLERMKNNAGSDQIEASYTNLEPVAVASADVAVEEQSSENPVYEADDSGPGQEEDEDATAKAAAKGKEKPGAAHGKKAKSKKSSGKKRR